MMETQLSNRKQGWQLIASGIVIGLLFQLLSVLISHLNNSALATLLANLGSGFNAVAMGLLIYLIIKEEFFDWFKHFSVKWIIIGVPTLLLVSTLSGSIWTAVAGPMAENSVNSTLSWSYVVTNVPFMLLGEELLSIGILYGAWKKLNWQFWQASLLCAFLFAVWHLSSYDFNLLQCLVTIIPSRLVLNYLFKKTDSIWVTLIVHIAFDVLAFVPTLIN